LVELLHSKSITQGRIDIEDWLREGLPHYLSKNLCQTHDIHYKESAHDVYNELWERIHVKYGLRVLRKILYSDDIKITMELLKKIFNYDKNDILEIPYDRVKELLNEE